MKLIRRYKSFTDDPEAPRTHCQEQFLFRKIEEDTDYCTVRVDFNDIGPGKRPPDFTVEVDWADVRRLVCTFIEMRQSEAIHLQEILELAKAIETAGWKPRDAPDDEFWEILPEPS